MDDTQRSLPKVVESPRESGAHWATIIGLSLSLPFAIFYSVALGASLITQFQHAAGVIEHPYGSYWEGVAMLFGMTAVFFFFLAAPGAVFAIIGFVTRRTRLARITLVVVAGPWLLTALYVLLALVMEAR